MNPKERLIVALDVDTGEKAAALASKLKDDAGAFKIGFELFSSCGPSVVKEISSSGGRVFLDLKFHDIPNTVSKAAVSVTRLGVFMFNVHALGGYDMMKKTSDAVSAEASRLKISRPKILAVTILTSMDQKALESVGISDKMEREVLKLAELAKSASLDGVVASPAEAAAIRQRCGEDFIIVTPGVRPAWAEAGDQKRVATPKEAIANGATYIVAGRPVTEAADPAGAAKKILKEISI
jgi:orotidine-5'-phosphate decarboxylase